MTWLGFATIQPPHRRGTGALPAAITSGRLRYGWSTPVGGSGALPDALAAHLNAHGGRVVTSAPVRRIRTGSGRATGVETVDGRLFRTRRAVVSSAHLAQLASLLDGPAPPDLRHAAETWRPGLALFAVHAALRGDVHYRTSTGAQVAVAGALGSPEGLRRQIQGCAEGRFEPDDPWLLIVSSTVVDPGRAPGGGGILNPHRGAPHDSPATATGTTRAPPPTPSGYCPGRAADRRPDPGDVLATMPESPASLARRNPHNLGGSCHGGEFDWRRRGSCRLAQPPLRRTGAPPHRGDGTSGWICQVRRPGATRPGASW
jgi:phytoene dehydrogenase-like protein